MDDEKTMDPAVVSMGLDCGNPVALAILKSGEVVLELGSGGGIDVRAHKAGSNTACESHLRTDARPPLSPRERALIAVGVARAARSEAELRSYIEVARGFGWTEEAIQGAIDLSDCTKEIGTRLSN